MYYFVKLPYLCHYACELSMWCTVGKHFGSYRWYKTEKWVISFQLRNNEQSSQNWAPSPWAYYITVCKTNGTAWISIGWTFKKYFQNQIRMTLKIRIWPWELRTLTLTYIWLCNAIKDAYPSANSYQHFDPGVHHTFDPESTETIAYFIILEKSQNKENPNSTDFNETRRVTDMFYAMNNKK